MNIKQALPWQLKIPAKIILSRLPAGYRLWQWLNLFKHGFMEEPDYAYRVFKEHYERVDFANKTNGFTVLEIGPGDTLFSAMLAHAHGAAHCYLVDVGRFARPDIGPYRKMAEELSKRGLPVPDIARAQTLIDVLSACKAEYLTDGLRSLEALPDQSVDFIWSQAVLEHIRYRDFSPMMQELRRVLRPGGVCSHRVDLTDHLNGGLNNLRFSARVWESKFMVRSGFYTNRIRYGDMLERFKIAGFNVEVTNVDRWTRLPTSPKNFADEFNGIPKDELMVSGFDVVLRSH